MAATRSIVPRNWIARLVIAVVLLGLVVAGGRVYGAASGAAGENRIRLGWVSSATWGPWRTLDKELPDGIDVEYVQFKSSNDVLTALSNGSLDMSPVGYNNVASLLTSAKPRLKFVSGISSRGSVFLARKGSGIEDWDDLKGKKIGGVRGSTQYVNMTAAMKARGIDVDKDTTFVNMQAFPDMNLALQRGDVDAITTFPPLSGEVLAAGYGSTVPTIQKSLYEGSFEVSSGIAATDSFLEKDRDKAKTVVEAYMKRLDELQSDPQKWQDDFATTSGGTGAGIADALKEGHFKGVYEMPSEDILRVPKVLTTMGIIDKDTSGDLLGYLDYSLLEEITGKPADQLGKTD
ncbi:ABC transporter substrate-binding protein [Brevibacterium sp. 91QC2O2]|uniref:ABC transporter substrate-binding protein n=1 Tax=Brevibacterium TaxID=1696 RepID=UPI00211BE549|nr:MULTISPECIES: ABC transporter substrate-binding protein [unclassified Brevibacterium]MCQ9367099.1 ABC transporter substrate-binding protein [Brevibacterium sp. 91QC2O2]MCQ9385454.1 ABC transporter substrate-binding protein [Brevibacterium sp. 68QC2CO]